MAIIFKKRLRKLTAANLKAGLFNRVFLFLGFATQTIGLTFTSPGKQAFITATYVVIVPFLSRGTSKIFPAGLSLHPFIALRDGPSLFKATVIRPLLLTKVTY